MATGLVSDNRMGRDEFDLRTHVAAFDLDTVKLLMSIFVSRQICYLSTRRLTFHPVDRIRTEAEQLGSTRCVYVSHGSRYFVCEKEGAVLLTTCQT